MAKRDLWLNPPDLVDWLAAEMLQHDVKPEIEAFDLSHILKARDMADKGQLKGTPYVQFVMGVKNAMPADKPVLRRWLRSVRYTRPFQITQVSLARLLWLK